MSNVNMYQEIEIEEMFHADETAEAEQFYANAALWQSGENFPMRDEYDSAEMDEDEMRLREALEHEWAESDDSVEYEYTGYDGE